MQAEIGRYAAAASFLQIGTTSSTSLAKTDSESPLGVATGDVDDWRERLGLERKDVEVTLERCEEAAAEQYSKSKKDAALNPYTEHSEQATMDARQSQNELRMKLNSSLAALDDDLEYAQKLYDQAEREHATALQRNLTASTSLNKARVDRDQALRKAKQNKDDSIRASNENLKEDLRREREEIEKSEKMRKTHMMPNVRQKFSSVLKQHNTLTKRQVYCVILFSSWNFWKASLSACKGSRGNCTPTISTNKWCSCSRPSR